MGDRPREAEKKPSPKARARKPQVAVCRPRSHYTGSPEAKMRTLRGEILLFQFRVEAGRLDAGARHSMFTIPVLTLTSWVTMDKLLVLSRPQFSHL